MEYNTLLLDGTSSHVKCKVEPSVGCCDSVDGMPTYMGSFGLTLLRCTLGAFEAKQHAVRVVHMSERMSAYAVIVRQQHCGSPSLASS